MLKAIGIFLGLIEDRPYKDWTLEKLTEQITLDAIDGDINTPFTREYDFRRADLESLWR